MTEHSPQHQSAQKSDQKSQPRQRKPGLRGHVAGIVALVALVVVAAVWFWSTRQPPQPDASVSVPNAVIVVGSGTFLVALIAEIRAMSFWEILELLWELILGVLSIVGAMFKAIWKGILGLFGL